MSLTRSPFARDVRRVARHPFTRAVVESLAVATFVIVVGTASVALFAWRAGMLR